MRDLSRNLNYRQGYYYAKYLFFVLMGIFQINLFLEFWNGGYGFLKYIALAGSFALFFKYYFDALNELLYTFWGLSTIFFAIQFYFYLDALDQSLYHHHASLNLLIILLFIAIFYLLSSPIYFPRVSWWEFDYRYRGDIKIEVNYHDQLSEGRLFDVRRGGGCVSSFEEFQLGQVITLKFHFALEDYKFQAIVGSKSQMVPGRPFSYGFMFILKSEGDKEAYDLLLENWRSKSKVKLDEKFYHERKK